ncbi:hypothetical protein BLEM_2087 [Bifidobacterium lemurum]|uniref:Uncharacterized protein n=1 Tax=Bifidobacterium lemurum TaxID=1603886 RepID=A0A261FL60_9BIFI|nr:hypothetical protein [Bifidobacterium lemurum]OZG59912.1 hypothetical protein BLEM_2087 [Bifidobacterium lemurum]QOL33938.1 hypothetical protein BL8807_09260 [Bifidobacterium lemurum]
MRLSKAIETLARWDATGRYVWLRRDLRKVFDENEETLSDTLDRLAKANILTRAARGVYVYRLSAHIGAGTLDLIARHLRRGELTYESLESALSAYGVISQIPIDRRTYVTTGRRGEYDTPYGVIEFTHTSVDKARIIPDLVTVEGRELPVASKRLALRNLKAAGRNMDLIDMEETDDERQ